MRMFWLAVALLCIAACSDSTNYNDESLGDEANSEYEPAEQETGSESLTFGGNPCTDDCSGHEAGYAWAEENGIDDPDSCGGNSQSFIEGCQTYAEEYAN